MKKKIIMVIFVLLVVFSLTGCTSAKAMNSAITGGGEWMLIPFAWLLDVFSFGNYYALGIIFTTIIIRTIAWPVYAKTNDMSLKMQLAQPELARIQTKYAGKQDPVSQQKMQREMMGLFKKYKINPLGCLVAPLIQFPLFMAMYNSVQRYPNVQKVTKTGEIISSMFTKVSTKLADGTIQAGPLKKSFLGIDLSSGINNIKDLGTASNWIYVILPILVGITMFLCQWLAQKKPSYAKKAYPGQVTNAQQSEKIMKIVMYVMVIMMVFMSFQSGTIALYWIVGNIYTILQTLINRKLSEKKYEKARETSNIIG